MRPLLLLIVTLPLANPLLAGPQSVPNPNLDPSVVRLAQIKNRMAQNLKGLPNYTCTETIERSQRRARGKKFQLIDTLRLEVALVNGKELFAWPGAGQFEDKDLREIVGTAGAVGNGNFALHARSVFLANSARFEFEGEAMFEGRPTLRYTFHVPRLLSGFRIRVGDQEGVSAYHGRFEAFADNYDLISLEVNAEEIPPNLPVSQAGDKLWYARQKIGETDYLLPQSSELTMTDTDGTESRNRVRLAGCHQFGTESTISFADPPPPSEAPAAVVPVELPADLFLEVALSKPVVFDQIAIGDLIEGKLVADARQSRKTIVPRGATVHGRVLRKTKTFNRTDILILEMELFEVDFPGAHAEIRALPFETSALSIAGGRISVSKQGIIYISGTRHELVVGTRIVWRTESKGNREKQ